MSRRGAYGVYFLGGDKLELEAEAKTLQFLLRNVRNKRFEFKKLVGRPRPWKLESLGNRLRRTLLVKKTLR